MNQVIISGNLVDKVRESVNQQGKLTVFGKLAVYNGKRPDGTQRDAMFFDIVVFNKDAEIIRDNTDKGCPIVVMGRLEEDTTVSQTNGQTYVNKKIVCTSARPLLKPVMVQNVAAQATQNMNPYSTAQNMDPFM
jgi:single-stranded DNA-binding protein